MYDEALHFAAEEEGFEKVMDLIKAVRAIRNDMGVHPSRRTSLIVETADPAPFQAGGSYLAKFAFASELTFTQRYAGETKGHVQVVTHAARAFIPMMELIDREKELARLQKEKAACEKEIASAAAKLANEGFVNKAPAAVVQKIRDTPRRGAGQNGKDRAVPCGPRLTGIRQRGEGPDDRPFSAYGRAIE